MDFSELQQDLTAARQLLANSQKFFTTETSFVAQMAAELEFFLTHADADFSFTQEDEFLASLTQICKNHGQQIGAATKEVGKLQYEVNFKHRDNLTALANDVLATKNIISDLAASYKLEANFQAKPYHAADVGSGMHLHLSLWSAGKNLFIKADHESEILLNSVAGLIELMPAALIFYVAGNEDFERFAAEFDIEQRDLRYKNHHTNAPTNLSWGINNRTTALRVTASAHDLNSRRIENRVPAAAANIHLALAATLLSSYYGIKNKLSPAPQIWGNAFDKQYNLTSFPVNFADAAAEYQYSELKDLVEGLV